MKTLAHYFAKLRADADLSYEDVAKKCKGTISRHVVWKLENGKPVKADTLGTILRGLGLRQTDRAYLEAFALWSAEQSHTLPSPDLEAAMKRMRQTDDRQFNEFAREVLTLASQAPASDRKAILEALGNLPALKLWLASRR